MWTWIAVGAVLLALVPFVWRARRSWAVPEYERGTSLRSTIAVNLSLLERELALLKPIAEEAQPSDDVMRARRLLEEADQLAIDADTDLSWADELEPVLGKVFNGLNRTAAARRLLGAVSVPDNLE